ncbi:hypothetical protein ACWFRF_14320 [Nocardia sp. NPDC055165]
MPKRKRPVRGSLDATGRGNWPYSPGIPPQPRRKLAPPPPRRKTDRED